MSEAQDLTSLGGGSEEELTEPIAVVGMAGRFPKAQSVRELWRNLREGVEGISFFTDEELRAAGVPEEEITGPGYIKAAPVIADPDLFDAGFFRMSRPEAEITDPQHRLFMECAWEALEDAGCDPARIRGTVGVYAGASLSGYLYFNLRHTFTLSEQGFQSLIGNDKDYLASHLAYKLDLGGPAVGIQSACSTSLVSVHLACQSLLSFECDLAIAGGATVRVPQVRGYSSQEGGIFASDGHCRPFDHRASGTLFGSGVGAVVLRRLEDAVAAGDRVYAVILGSAVNNDGARKVGYTAPGEDGQVRVVSEALEVAGVDPEEIGFVESHGTGTALGDPIEVSALSRVFRGTPSGDQCALGAVKSNLGHLESAAGIAGLIKAVLAVHHGEIPPTLHFEAENPMINLGSSPFFVNTELCAWPNSAGPRRAGVSSFGIGGTNAHVVLAETPAASAPVPVPAKHLEAPQLLPISARDPAALRLLVEAYEARLQDADAAERHRLAAGAALRRAHHEYRQALIFSPADGASTASDNAARDLSEVGPSSDRVDPERRPKVVFVFPGQGSQWLGMGRSLMASEEVFRRALEECDAAIRQWTDWSLLEVLAADEASSRLDELDVVQPTLFAMEVALAALWRSWGVEPDALIGHSMGEVAAACVSGALSLADATRVICRRSRLALKVRGRGAMAVVELPADAARDALGTESGAVAVAARNSPRSTVLSGDAEALRRVLERLDEGGVYHRWIKVDFASHSPQVDPLLEELSETLSGVTPRAGDVPIYSTVDGELTDGADFGTDYWVRNLRSPVLLSDMVEQARSDGHDLFIEVSPHPILVPSLTDCLAAASGDAVALPSTRRDADEREALLGTLGEFYTRGGAVAWSTVYPEGSPFVELPAYPWQRQRYWIDPIEAPVRRAAGHHPLLGESLRSSLHPGTEFWEHRLAAEDPDLAALRVQGAPAQPVARQLEMALAAAERHMGKETSGSPAIGLAEVSLYPDLALEDEGSEELMQLVLSTDNGTAFHVASQPVSGDADWTTRAAGRVISGQAASGARSGKEPLELRAIRDRCTEVLDGKKFYRERLEAGIEIGDAYRVMAEVRRRDGEALGRLEPPDGESWEAGDGSRVPPALLEACFQALAAAAPPSEGGPVAYLPTAVGSLEFHGQPGGEIQAHAVLRSADEGATVPSAKVLEGDVTLTDGDGHPLIVARGLRARWPVEHWLYEVRWDVAEPLDDAVDRGEPGIWLIIADRGGVSEALAAALVEAGARATRVVIGDSDRGAKEDVTETIVDPGRPEELRRLLERTAVDDTPVHGIVDLRGLDAGFPEGGGEEDVPGAAAVACEGLLKLAGGLADAEGGSTPELVVVTAGSDGPAEGGLPVAVAQAPLWGMGAVIGNEHPELGCRLVNLCASTDSTAQIGGLARELIAGDENRVAIRDDKRLVARLMPRRLPVAADMPVRPDGTYLVTGGLGGLGLAAARFLVDRGARHLALLGRSASQPAAIDAVRELEAAGAQVRPLRADVADYAALAAVMEEIRREMPALRGVIHAAGVREDGPVEEGLLSRLTMERFVAVMAPKVAGSWNLHRLTTELDLDFFVLYASVVSLFGSLGQSAYAAANSFLDALAEHRRQHGLAGLAVDWGAWADAGMASAAPDLEVRLAYEGMASMASADALSTLDRLLAAGSAAPARVAVMPYRHTLRQRFDPQGSTAPLFAGLAAVGTGPGEAGAAFIDRFEEAEMEERSAMIAGYLVERVTEALRVGPDEIDDDVPLNQLGLSSLISLEVRNRIERDLDLSIPIVQFLESNSLREFAAQLAERLTVERLLANVTAEAPVLDDEEEWEQLTL